VPCRPDPWAGYAQHPWRPDWL
jgi:hypothetical protein